MDGKKSGVDIFLEYVPSLRVWHKALLTYIYQFIVFILLLVFFWWISSKIFYGALIGQIFITFCFTIPYVYYIKNIEKIREIYRKNYGKLAYQHFYFKFMIYMPPFGNASAFLPLLLIKYDFLPTIITISNPVINAFNFPFYSSIPIGIFFIIIGVLIRRPSGGFDVDTQLLVYLIFPENSKKIQSGIYKFIRHPQYAGEGFVIMGIGIFANNLLAIGVALIHFLAYLLVIKIEDGELIKRFGDDFRSYQKKVPALFPKYGNWREFFRFIFSY